MLLSKVYSHGLLSFIHGVLQNIDALFSDTCSVRALVAFPCETETPELCSLGNTTRGISLSQHLHVPCFVHKTHALEHRLSSAGHIIVSLGISASYGVHKRLCFKYSLWSDIEAETEFFCCLHSCCLQTLMLSRAEICYAENLHTIKCLLFFC